MTPDDFRRLALSQPKAVEVYRGGHSEFRVLRRSFASLEGPAIATVQAHVGKASHVHAMQRNGFSCKCQGAGVGSEPPMLCSRTLMKRSLKAPSWWLGATSSQSDHCPLTLGNVDGSPTPGNHTAETGLAGCPGRIRTGLRRFRTGLLASRQCHRLALYGMAGASGGRPRAASGGTMGGKSRIARGRPRSCGRETCSMYALLGFSKYILWRSRSCPMIKADRQYWPLFQKSFISEILSSAVISKQLLHQRRQRSVIGLRSLSGSGLLPGANFAKGFRLAGS